LVFGEQCYFELKCSWW